MIEYDEFKTLIKKMVNKIDKYPIRYGNTILFSPYIKIIYKKHKYKLYKNNLFVYETENRVTALTWAIYEYYGIQSANDIIDIDQKLRYIEFDIEVSRKMTNDDDKLFIHLVRLSEYTRKKHEYNRKLKNYALNIKNIKEKTLAIS